MPAGSERRRIKLLHAGAFLLSGAGIALLLAFGQPLIEFILSVAFPMTATNPPVKVRGGAMTFRSTVPFLKEGSHDCVPINANTYMYVYEPGDKTGSPTHQYLLAEGVQIDLFGYSSKGVTNSAQGVRVLITTACGGNPLGASIFAEPGTKSTFYPLNDGTTPDEDHITYRKRFEDATCNGLNPASGQDEDTCEHLSTIYVNKSPTIAPKVSPTKGPWSCVDGECRIEIGGSL